MNRKLLEQVRDQIAAHPDHFNMAEWFNDGTVPESQPKVFLDSVRELDCGTTACIAGWAVALAPEDEAEEALRTSSTVGLAASKLLKLPYYRASNIFMDESWPSPFYEKFNDAVGRSQEAAVAVEYINHLLAEDLKVNPQ